MFITTHSSYYLIPGQRFNLAIKMFLAQIENFKLIRKKNKNNLVVLPFREVNDL